MKKLFVGNLPWQANEDSLKQHFESCGNVLSVKVVTDQYTGKSKGFGFVEMESAEEAQRAIDQLNEQPMLGRNLRVSMAQERSSAPGGFSSRGGPGGGSGGGGNGGGNGGGGAGGKSFGGPRRSFGGGSGGY